MERKQFDELEIKLQVEYINKEIIKHKTLTGVCKNIGISRSSVRNRFKKAGYIYDADTKAYLDNTIVTGLENSEVHSSDTEVILKEKINKNSIQVHSSNTSVISKKEVLEMVNLKTDIVKMMQEHKELMEWYQIQKTKDKVIDIPELKIQADKLTGESKRKVFVLHKDILDQFMEFAGKYKEYTIKDLTSQALLEFMEKYSQQ